MSTNPPPSKDYPQQTEELKDFVRQQLQSARSRFGIVLWLVDHHQISQAQANEIVNEVAAEFHPSHPSPIVENPLLPQELSVKPQLKDVIEDSIDDLPNRTLNLFWVVLLRLLAVLLTLSCAILMIEVQPIVVGTMVAVVIAFVALNRPRQSVKLISEWFLGFGPVVDSHTRKRDLDQTELSLMLDEVSETIVWQRELVIANALGNSVDTRAVPILGRMLSSENGYIVVAAAQSLGKIGSDEAIQVLGNAYDQQLSKSGKKAIGDILSKIEVLAPNDVRYSVNLLNPRLGCVAWYAAWIAVATLFLLVYFIAFGVLASSDIRDFYEVEIPQSAVITTIVQILVGGGIAYGFWNMRVWSIYLTIGILSLAALLTVCVLITQGGLGAIIMLTVTVGILAWLRNQREYFRGDPAFAVPKSQELTSLTYAAENSTRLLQLHEWLTGLTLVATLVGGLAIVPQVEVNTLLWLGICAFIVVIPNWRVSRRLRWVGSYVVWGTLLVWISIVLIFSVLGLAALYVVELANVSTDVDKLTGISIGFLIGAILGVVLCRHVKTWSFGSPMGTFTARTKRYTAARWSIVGAVLCIPFTFTVFEPTIGEFSDKLRNAIQPPTVESVQEQVNDRIKQGLDAVDEMEGRWNTLRLGGLVQCHRPNIPRRIQVTRDIAEANPDLVEAVVHYHNGIDLIDESAETLFDGCRTEITLEVYFEGLGQAENARIQFDLATEALQRSRE